jgi:hypothetical protein
VLIASPEADISCSQSEGLRASFRARAKPVSGVAWLTGKFAPQSTYSHKPKSLLYECMFTTSGGSNRGALAVKEYFAKMTGAGGRGVSRSRRQEEPHCLRKEGSRPLQSHGCAISAAGSEAVAPALVTCHRMQALPTCSQSPYHQWWQETGSKLSNFGRGSVTIRGRRRR